MSGRQDERMPHTIFYQSDGPQRCGHNVPCIHVPVYDIRTKASCHPNHSSEKTHEIPERCLVSDISLILLSHFLLIFTPAPKYTDCYVMSPRGQSNSQGSACSCSPPPNLRTRKRMRKRRAANELAAAFIIT